MYCDANLPLNTLVYGLLLSVGVLFLGGVFLDFFSATSYFVLFVSGALFSYPVATIQFQYPPRNFISRGSQIAIAIVSAIALLQILQSFGLIAVLPEHLITINFYEKFAIWWNSDVPLHKQNIVLNASILFGFLMYLSSPEIKKARQEMLREFKSHLEAEKDLEENPVD